jgi:hypothetical protein
MGFYRGPRVITNGLVLALDAGSERSYSQLPQKMDVLIVGGGGAGGTDLDYAGGGGGAVVYFTGLQMTPTPYTITIGAGGTPNASNGAGGQGGSTLAFGETAGGGQGGGQIASSTAGNSGTITVQASSSDYDTVASYSNIAGGVSTAPNPGAGGAGAGEVGQSYSGSNSTAENPAGSGGDGIQIDIDGNNYYWAGGGGGEGYSDYAGDGGLGGGGGGGVFSLSADYINVGTGGGSALNSGIDGGHANDALNGGAGGANTGGGGGGGSHTGGGQTSIRGGAGGSGIVIIRYIGYPKATGGTVVTSGGYTTHTFTTSGTFGISTTWADLSGNENHGTMVNTTYSSEGNGSMDFGTPNYVTIPHDTSYKPTTTISIALWFKPESRPYFGKLLSLPYDDTSWADPYVTYDISQTYTTTGKPSFLLTTGGNESYATATTAIDNGTWCYVVGTYDGSNMRIYINGTLEDTTAKSGVIDYNGQTNKLTLGRQGENLSGEYCDSKTAIVHIYNKTLSQTEITQNFNAQKGRFGL